MTWGFKSLREHSGDTMIQAKLDRVLEADKTAAQFEEDNKGQYWCGICKRSTADCDAHPNEHQFGPKGLCAGIALRTALREFGIDLPSLPDDENPNI